MKINPMFNYDSQLVYFLHCCAAKGTYQYLRTESAVFIFYPDSGCQLIRLILLKTTRKLG